MQVTPVQKILLLEFFQKNTDFIQDTRQNLKHDLKDWKCPAGLRNYSFFIIS